MQISQINLNLTWQCTHNVMMGPSSGLPLNAVHCVSELVVPARRARLCLSNPCTPVSQLPRFRSDHLGGVGIIFVLVIIINEGIIFRLFRVLFVRMLLSNFCSRLSCLVDVSLGSSNTATAEHSALQQYLCHRFCVYRSRHSLTWITLLS